MSRRWFRFAASFSLGALVGSAGCASGEMPTSKTAADPGVAIAELPMSNVLQAGFDPDVLAPVGAAAGGTEAHHHGHGAAEASDADAVYTCVMHPEVLSDKPGKCPKCGMDLVLKKPEPKPAEPTPAGPTSEPKRPEPKKPEPVEPSMPPGHKM